MNNMNMEPVESVVAESLNDLWDQMRNKKGKVKIELKNPVNMNDLVFSDHKPYFANCEKRIIEIRIPSGGNIYSTQDGKMLLHRKGNGNLTLEFTFGEWDHADVPDGVDVIGDCAFQEKPVISVSLPDSVRIIGSFAFYYCRHLKTVRMPKNLKQIDNMAFNSCESLEKMIIPDSVEEIGEYSFSGCKKLKEVVLPEKIQEIQSHAFYCCTSLQRVVIKKGVKTIGAGAFSECENLSDIQLPEGLENIEEYAFCGCRNIKYLKLPESLKSLSDDSLTGVQVVEIAKPIPKLAKAFMEGSEEEKCCFSVIFGDRTLIFPREMDGLSMRKTSEILEDIAELEPGVHSYYTFALTTKLKQETALESILLSHDEEIWKYLRRNTSAMIAREAEAGEEPFLELVIKTSKENLLTDTAIKKALKISKEKEWTLATAEILQIMEGQKKNRKNGFKL